MNVEFSFDYYTDNVEVLLYYWLQVNVQLKRKKVV